MLGPQIVDKYGLDRGLKYAHESNRCWARPFNGIISKVVVEGIPVWTP
jgi:hypothetical protein